MNRDYKTFNIQKEEHGYFPFLNWAESKEHYYAFFNSNSYEDDSYSEFDALLAVGIFDQICPKKNDDAFKELKLFSDKHERDWLLGLLSYDLKNQIEELNSKNSDKIEMPLMHFFVPVIIFIFRKNEVEIGIRKEFCNEYGHEQIIKEIGHQKENHFQAKNTQLKISHKVKRTDYIANVEKIKEHIKKGNIYEANYCIEFFAHHNNFKPLKCFQNLTKNNPAPFSSFYRFDNKYLISSSPERFLAKRGNTLISQPIKGTIRRGKTTSEDNELKKQLANDPKERSENIMIVDLVRNDLSYSAKNGSVLVKELCGIYSYPKVHQMISTIISELRDDIHFMDSLKMAFPMGSMTGAPKIKAMQLIDEYETTQRGLYSGAVGYISPNRNFDFNVVIRSVLYNKENQYISFMAGSAITIESDPEKEYKECILKASALAESLDSKL